MKSVPIRTCIGCGRKSQKWEFIRIGYTKDGRILLSLNAKGEGRGAYVCPDERCIEIAMKPKRINKALRAQLSQSQVDSLKAQLLGLLGEIRGGINNGEGETQKSPYD